MGAVNAWNAPSQEDIQAMNLEMMREQQKFNREEAGTAFERQKELMEMQRGYSLDYKGQVQALKEAGINPSLFISKGGGVTGGQTSASGAPQAGAASALGANVTDRTSAGMALAQQAQQLAMQQAQVKALEAQANKDNASADKTKGADTALTLQQVAGQELANKMQDIRNQIVQTTSKDEIERIRAEADRAVTDSLVALERLEAEKRENRLNEETFEERKNALILSNAETYAGILLKEEEISLTKENVKALGERIRQEWASIANEARNIGYQHEDRQLTVSQQRTDSLRRYIVGMKGVEVGEAGVETQRRGQIFNIAGDILKTGAMLYLGRGYSASKAVKATAKPTVQSNIIWSY